MTHDGFYTAGSTRWVLHGGFYTAGSTRRVLRGGFALLSLSDYC